MTTLDAPARGSQHDSPYEDIGTFVGRKPQMHSHAGLQIISADNHFGLGGKDLWYDAAPPELKDRVPRVYFDEKQGFWTCSFAGKPVYPPGTEAVIGSVEGRDSIWNIETRIKDLEAEGIDAEIAFPQVLPLTLFKLPDFEAREFIMAEYNRHLSAVQAKAPGVFYGVGIPNYWNPAKARESLQAIKDLGLRTIMLPCDPGTFEDGSPIVFNADRMKPLWEAIAELDLTVCFHIGERPGFACKGGLAMAVLNNMLGPDFRQIWGQLVFGGVFDEFPDLRIVFAEANIHWVPGMLQDADMVPDSFAGLIDYVPKLRPSEYWYRNCAATFMRDPVGLRMLDKVGPGNAMWSVDYPHNESTFGYSGTVVDSIIDAVGMETARLLLSENAKRWFKI